MKRGVRWRIWPPLRQGVPVLLAAACAVWAAQRYLSVQTAEIQAAAQGAQGEFLVADHDLAAGTVLTLSELALRAVPLAWLGSHALREGDLSRVLGRTLAWSVQAGEPLRDMHLAASAPRRLADRLAPGRRALTIPLSQASTQSGLLQPGDRIDLYVDLAHQGRRATTALLQDVTVLATGASMEDSLEGAGGRAFSAVTLDVSQEDALLVLAARDEGDIVAVLRGSQDALNAATSSGMSNVPRFGSAPPRRPAAPVVLYGNRGARHVPPLDGMSEWEWDE